MSTKINAVVVLANKELQVEGEVQGANNSQMEIVVTKVMLDNKDITPFWELLEDSFKVKSALEKTYYNLKINSASQVLRQLEVAIQDAQRTLTNW